MGIQDEASGVYIPTPEKNGLTKKILKGIGVGGAIVGGGILYLVFIVLRFLYIAFAGLSMIWFSVTLFQGGHIVWGLVALILGTPIAIGVASYLFIPVLLFTLVALLIWGITSLLGIQTSFDDIWAWLWLTFKITLMAFIAFLGIVQFVEAIKSKQIWQFFKESWFFIVLYLFLLWVFF